MYGIYSLQISGTMTSQVSKAANPWEDSFRLPSTVHPDHYDLYTHPDLTTKTFSGRVSITVTTSEPRDHFLIHTKWLNITSTDVVRVVDGSTQVGFLSFTYCFFVVVVKMVCTVWLKQILYGLMKLWM